MDIGERFWSKVDIRGEDDCWEWTAYLEDGYGKIRIAGKSVLAHRVAYELTKGPIPEGLCVCHRCDNRKCVNPRHLWLGTNADNVADREAKGRNRLPDCKGEAHGNAKLTAEDVLRIRELYDDGGYTQKEIARLFGIARTQVSRIVNGHHWRHV